MPKTTPQLTPQSIQDLIAHVQTKPEYKNDARVKALVDQKVAQLRYLAGGDLDVLETLGKISGIIQEISTALVVVANPVPAPVIDLAPADGPVPSPAADPTQDSALAQSAINETDRLELMQTLDLSFSDMVVTLREFGFQNATIPKRQKVFDAIKKLSPEMLETISNFGKPTIVITPPGSFAEKVQHINARKKIVWKQNLVVCSPAPINVLWGPVSTAWNVTIVDGVDSMLEPSYITYGLSHDQKMEKYETEFAKKNLEVMSCQEGAMLIMKFLKFGQHIDNAFSSDFETITYYNRSHLPKNSFLACSYWNLHTDTVCFSKRNPVSRRSDMRCRPSVRILV